MLLEKSGVKDVNIRNKGVYLDRPASGGMKRKERAWLVRTVDEKKLIGRLVDNQRDMRKEEEVKDKEEGGRKGDMTILPPVLNCR